MSTVLSPELLRLPSTSRPSAALFYNSEPNARESMLQGADYDRSFSDLITIFYNLLKKWKTETFTCSSVHQMYQNINYQRIIDLGESVIPLLLGELKREPDFLFGALSALTGKDPVNPDNLGDVTAMANDWLEWAQNEGIMIV